MQTQRDADAMLDRWMRETLSERYGRALHEPMPEALLRLLDDADRQGALERAR